MEPPLQTPQPPTHRYNTRSRNTTTIPPAKLPPEPSTPEASRKQTITASPPPWELHGRPPPRFTVDLSLPPEHRYDHIIPHMKPALEQGDVLGLFSSLISSVTPNAPLLRASLHLLTRVAFRRVHSDEETAELRGISRSTGQPMYLLVAFNVLLDLLLGCTSGGVRYDDGSSSRSHMVHFRTLDWSMDPLRHIVIELDFVTHRDGPVIATTVGYFGYVGVITGVRKGLSLSLNHRATHDRSTLSKRLSYRWHQVMVLLGQRPSISSTLRHHLFTTSPATRRSPKQKHNPIITKREKPQPTTTTPDMPTILNALTHAPSTAAYLIFCTPTAAYALEQDNHTARIHTSSTLLTTCNHDVAEEDSFTQLVPTNRVSTTVKEHRWIPFLSSSSPSESPQAPTASPSFEESDGDSESSASVDFTAEEIAQLILEDSITRKETVNSVWASRLEQRRLRKPSSDGVGLEDVLHMLGAEEISGEPTHYAVVMDPEHGKVLWRRVYDVGELEPASDSDSDLDSVSA
ncbi:beta subunit of N-acylethanolamine-hydrolyzing acid amidase-domain-containing protein [Podospora appendiculata]|uniref:ceramidase n=1 Tax=Podospora appendiculata TaxID=314037 RepID=A0AAE1CG72_9PEZI|nr:beta subunit of N-acylethanolamine-hydrolyzing acid amidase-domain-containing protein [Podospora appendiculata]